MKLTQLRISNFQSFGKTAVVIRFEATTFLLGPNGAGKTAVLQAISRMFAFDPSLRRIQRSDFHVAPEDLAKETLDPVSMWLEAEFEFPETKDAQDKHATIPSNFAHMRLASKDGVPRVRFRLQAQMDQDGDIEETLHYVLETDEHGTPGKMAPVAKHDRSAIQVHYLPARRDPSEHISYAANSLLGRALRAANWQAERESIKALAENISNELAGNEAVESINQQLTTHWTALHKGAYYTNPSMSFERNEIDILLRYLTIEFMPGHEAHSVDFSRLSDGQKSLLYVSLVLAMQAIGRRVLKGELGAFNIAKLRPAVFTLVAMEEPENSLSPHYLGRMVKLLTSFAAGHDAQAIVATHSPALIKRVPPENIRYLRLGANRETVVKTIMMPDSKDDAYKFVREAVQSFPELYFSRLVILGEGDSEEIVLPRLLQAWGVSEDDTSISVAPLGGRHVNHFWRLLHGLDIPFVTLLDLDLGRHQGGWGRVRYAIQQLLKYSPHSATLTQPMVDLLPKWDSDDYFLNSQQGQKWLSWLESVGVFFSSPLDIDFAMLRQFPIAYGATADKLPVPDEKAIIAVLGKSHGMVDQYDQESQKYFDVYHQLFKLGSKPAAHLGALAKLDDLQLQRDAPASMVRLLTSVQAKLGGLPE